MHSSTWKGQDRNSHTLLQKPSTPFVTKNTTRYPESFDWVVFDGGDTRVYAMSNFRPNHLYNFPRSQNTAAFLTPRAKEIDKISVRYYDSNKGTHVVAQPFPHQEEAAKHTLNKYYQRPEALKPIAPYFMTKLPVENLSSRHGLAIPVRSREDYGGTIVEMIYVGTTKVPSLMTVVLTGKKRNSTKSKSKQSNKSQGGKNQSAKSKASTSRGKNGNKSTKSPVGTSSSSRIRQ